MMLESRNLAPEFLGAFHSPLHSFNCVASDLSEVEKSTVVGVCAKRRIMKRIWYKIQSDIFCQLPVEVEIVLEQINFIRMQIAFAVKYTTRSD